MPRRPAEALDATKAVHPYEHAFLDCSIKRWGRIRASTTWAVLYANIIRVLKEHIAFAKTKRNIWSPG